MYKGHLHTTGLGIADIVVAEALAYPFTLKLGGWRALGTLIVANVRSFVLGIIVGKG